MSDDVMLVVGLDALRAAAEANPNAEFSLELASNDEPAWIELINSELLARVVALSSVRAGRLPARVFELLASTAALEHLRQLSLGPCIDADGLLALASSPHLGRLRAVHLSSIDVPNEAVVALLRSWGPQLTWLRAERMQLGPDSLAMFEQPWPALTSLQLVRNPLTDVGIERLAATSLPGLVDLDLTATKMTALGAKALAESKLLDGVEDLTLSHNELGPGGIEALAGSAHTRRLRHLRVHACAIQDAGATAIANSGWKLETLDISECWLFNGGGLAGADFLAGLTSFNIEGNKHFFQDRRCVDALLDTGLSQAFKDDLRREFELENE